MKALLGLTALIAASLVWGSRQTRLRRLEADSEKYARARSLHFDATRLAIPEDASWIDQANYYLYGPRVTKLVVNWDAEVSKDFLSPFTELTELRFAQNSRSFEDLSKLGEMKSLKVLDLEETSVKDLRPLASMTKLKRLYLRTTSVSDLAPLSGMHSLRGLYLDNTPIDDLQPIANLVGLESLWIPGTKVTSLEPILGLRNLVELNITGLPQVDVQVAKKLPKLEILHSDN